METGSPHQSGSGHIRVNSAARRGEAVEGLELSFPKLPSVPVWWGMNTTYPVCAAGGGAQMPAGLWLEDIPQRDDHGG